MERVVLKQIIKTKEPKSLTTYRAGISKKDLANLEKFDDSPSIVKDDLRSKLLEEQGYICCYCMERIGFRKSKIEHFKPRSLFRSEQLDYFNLFVACHGGEGQNKNEQHCDTKKANNLLNNIKLLKNIESDIAYKKDGCIFSKNTAIEKELNDVLNLNYINLKKNRADVLYQVLLELEKNNWTTSNLKTNLRKYQTENSKGKYRPFSQMIVYFLTKKLKQKEGNKQ